jgi:hypothetical protein
MANDALIIQNASLDTTNDAFVTMNAAFVMTNASFVVTNDACVVTNDYFVVTNVSFAETNDALITTNASSRATNDAFHRHIASFYEANDHRLTEVPPPPMEIVMSTTINRARHSTVTLKLPLGVSALVTYAKGIVTRMTANPSFPNPAPSLAAVTAAIDDLHVAETAALARTKGAVATRNDKRAALILLLKQLGGYIQTTADASAENGAAVIESAGIAVRKTPTRLARAFAAKPGPVSGTAKVLATVAGRRASYEWQYSSDGGKTWITAPATLQAKTTIAGLSLGATVLFKYRPVTKAGEGDWSQPASLVIS